MRILLIGGTGNISTACTQLLLKKGWEVFHLNRGKSTNPKIDGVQSLYCDINDENSVIRAIGQLTFDAIANFIAFSASDVERDFRLFHNRTKQYIFISSASCYEKPNVFKPITEETPLYNTVWEYSQNKIKAEELLIHLYKEKGFPVTIIRPSLTYQYVIPVPLGGWTDYTIVDRIRKGKPIVVHGDGTSLWTITHSEDFAVGFEGLANNSAAIGEAFHITSDEVLTWNQMHQSIADAIGCTANIDNSKWL
jgi:nucleoside-diphosphate-sugar epimerase